MATKNFTPNVEATANELAIQFPCNAEPFAFWYFLDEEEESRNHYWAVNNEDGEAVYETRSFEDAVKLSSALASKPENLKDVQASLQRMMINRDGRTKSLIDAGDKLNEAAFMAKFIQSISLNAPNEGSIVLNPDQLTGFYFAMKNTIDRIKEAQVLIVEARKLAEALPA